MALNKGYILKKLGNEYMIIKINDGSVNVTKTFNINETGAIIFNGLKDNLTKEEITKNIINEFNIDYDTAYNDVFEFISILKEKGIYND